MNYTPIADTRETITTKTHAMIGGDGGTEREEGKDTAREEGGVNGEGMEGGEEREN